MPRHISPSLVISVIALCVALGGTSYAVVKLPRGSVGSTQLARGAVTASKLRSSAVTSAKVRDGSLLARDFAAGQLPAAERGPQGERGPAGERGPSEAHRVVGPAPVGLVPGSAVEVASITVPAGAYTVMASGFVYPSGAAVGGSDQYFCSIWEAGGAYVGGMPSQVTLDAAQQFVALGAGEATAAVNATTGKLRVLCTQIAVDGADPSFTEINATIIATRVAAVAP